MDRRTRAKPRIIKRVRAEHSDLFVIGPSLSTTCPRKVHHVSREPLKQIASGTVVANDLAGIYAGMRGAYIISDSSVKEFNGPENC